MGFLYVDWNSAEAGNSVYYEDGIWVHGVNGLSDVLNGIYKPTSMFGVHQGDMGYLTLLIRVSVIGGGGLRLFDQFLPYSLRRNSRIVIKFNFLIWYFGILDYRLHPRTDCSI